MTVEQDVERIVVVGGGVGGATAVAELRRAGFAGAITLICGEPTVPYERPPLSKAFLLDDTAGDGADTAVHPPEWYPAHAVDLRLDTTATALDTSARQVTLSEGGGLRYDRLLLATGVRPRTLAGVAGPRVHQLRTVADAVALRAALPAAGHVAVLGGGFVGCEVAAAAVRLGKRVTLLESLPTLLHRALGAQLGGVVGDIHRDQGVDVRTGCSVVGVQEVGTAVVVTTDDGRFDCDVLVVGVGSVPNQELAEHAGLAVDDGVLVDEFCATSTPEVYAIGDVARQHRPGHEHGVRVEHHDSAIRQAKVAARNLLGAREPFSDVHWFWSDQYEHTIQSSGNAAAGELVIRGSLRERSFSAFRLDGGRVRSVVSLDRPRDVLDTRRLISRDHDLTAAQLQDEAVPIKRLGTPPRAAMSTKERL
jgi:3-phenylpropionate/trans-cinnamate dioxygenase ferredoxin reductase subunit